MSAELNEVLVDRVDALGSDPWSGQCFRYTAARRDPLSGEGARRHGGRWNPPDLFPAIYLADSEQACMSEVDRVAEVAGLGAEEMLTVPYKLHTIDVNGLAVLDLRTEKAQEFVGLEIEDLFGKDWAACQAVGHAAWFLEMAGVLAPAAGGIGLVVTALGHRAQRGQVQVRTTDDLTPKLYKILRGGIASRLFGAWLGLSTRTYSDGYPPSPSPIDGVLVTLLAPTAAGERVLLAPDLAHNRARIHAKFGLRPHSNRCVGEGSAYGTGRHRWKRATNLRCQGVSTAPWL